MSVWVEEPESPRRMYSFRICAGAGDPYHDPDGGAHHGPLRLTIPLRVEDIYVVLGGVFNDFSNTVLDEFTDLMRNHGDWVQRYVETRLQEWHEGNARRRMAALRICRFLRDATCNPVYAACRRRLEAEPMDMTTG